MLRQWRFVASLGLDLLGFLAQLVALRRLPVFAVQAMVAGSLAVTAVLAAWLIDVQLAWREWLAVAGVVVGVGLLGASAGAEGAHAVSGPFKLALLLAVAGVAGAGLLASRLAVPARTPRSAPSRGSATAWSPWPRGCCPGTPCRNCSATRPRTPSWPRAWCRSCSTPPRWTAAA